MKLTNLKHSQQKLQNGGKILVLNTGAVIKPESEAMLQALHSRSVGGIYEHLKVLNEKGSKNFMSTFYVGYGHKSIGDCGNATIFIEGVSMLAAKAIQDWRLYSGQEASTRYVDFAKQKFINPVDKKSAEVILEDWRKFYLKGVKEIVPDLKERYPINKNEKERLYEKAIQARAFDIMRGFLPSGASTNLAWHSNLRQIADKLTELRHHPLKEVRTVALSIEKAVLEAFPNSFTLKRYPETEKYIKKYMKDYYLKDRSTPEFSLSNDSVKTDLLKKYRKLIAVRPPRTELPRQIAECGTVEFRFLLDFGSFRDIQRQRAVIQRMPLVTDYYGFNSWYLEQLTPELRKEAQHLINKQKKAVNKLKLTPEIKQYYLPMGYNIPNRLTGDLHALVYLTELRATRFVHPTLRKVALEMAEELKKRHRIKIHLDNDPDRFDIKRGEHDIVIKK